MMNKSIFAEAGKVLLVKVPLITDLDRFFPKLSLVPPYVYQLYVFFDDIEEAREYERKQVVSFRGFKFYPASFKGKLGLFRSVKHGDFDELNRFFNCQTEEYIQSFQRDMERYIDGYVESNHAALSELSNLCSQRVDACQELLDKAPVEGYDVNYVRFLNNKKEAYENILYTIEEDLKQTQRKGRLK